MTAGKSMLTEQPFALDTGHSVNIELDGFLHKPVNHDNEYMDAIDIDAASATIREAYRAAAIVVAERSRRRHVEIKPSRHHFVQHFGGTAERHVEPGKARRQAEAPGGEMRPVTGRQRRASASPPSARALPADTCYPRA